MSVRQICFATLILATLFANRGSRAGGQSVPKPQSEPKAVSGTGTSIALTVAGEVAHPLSLTGTEFAKLPRQSVRAKGHDGVESQYEGVPLIDFLAKAGVPVGKDLRGPAMSLFVIVEAADNYRAVFAIAELDQAFTDRVILVADHRDGRPLSSREGPLQIVVPGEKKHARWVRQVTKLKIGRG